MAGFEKDVNSDKKINSMFNIGSKSDELMEALKSEDIKSRLEKMCDSGKGFDFGELMTILYSMCIFNTMNNGCHAVVSMKDVINDVLDAIENLQNKIIPEKYPEYLLGSFALRNLVIRENFAVISRDWIQDLVSWIGNRKCLEIMSGKGMLSKALQQEGVNVVATDNYSTNHFNYKDLWTDVENIDAISAIEKYGRDIEIIIMSWCDMSNVGYKALMKMREVNPNAIMIYIGEGSGGCTGSDSLYQAMEDIQDWDFDKLNDIFPSWRGIYDRLYLIK